MRTKRKKNKMPAGISWVFLLFPYYNWIALIVLGVWNSRWLAVLSAFVYCTLHSLFPDQFIEWWICTIVHYLLVWIFLKRKLGNDVLLEKEQKKRRRTEHQTGQGGALLENLELETQQKQEKGIDFASRQKTNLIQGSNSAEVKKLQNESGIIERKKDKVLSLNLNFENINELRRQSELVRDALEVKNEEKNSSIEEESSDKQEDSNLGDEISGKGKGEKDDKDKIQNVIKNFSEQQKKMLKTILFEDGAAELLEQIAEEIFSMPEIMADEMNDLAMEYLDDLLIDVNGDIWTVFEQYEEEVKKYFAQNE